MRNLGAREEDLVLIGRGHCNRPCVAAGPIKEIWRTVADATRRGYVLEANWDAEAGQRRIFAKGVIRQNRTAICRGGGQRADRRSGWDMGVLKIRRDGPRRRIVCIDQGKECRIVLE